MTILFLVLSTFLLVLTAGMAWLIRGSVANPEQRTVGIVLCFFLCASAFLLLALAGLPKSVAVSVIAGFVMIGYFLDDILRWFFPDPAKKAPVE